MLISLLTGLGTVSNLSASRGTIAQSVPRKRSRQGPVAWLVKIDASRDKDPVIKLMKAEEFDPNGEIDKAERELRCCLIKQAGLLAENRCFDQALTLYFRAYALKPTVTPVLLSIAEIYDALGDPESATTCRRGVIPESAEEQYFAKKHYVRRIKPAHKASNCQHIKTHRANNVTLRSPLSNGCAKEKPEFRVTKTDSLGSFVSIVQNGGVWFDGFNTVIFDDKQNMLKEHVKGSPYAVGEAVRFRPERNLNATVCFLDTRSSSIYYHWMIDVLPKFALLRQSAIPLDSIDYFIVRSRSAFQRETLAKLGVPDDRVIDPWTIGITRCSRLIVPYLKHDKGERFYNGMGLGMASWVPRWLQSTFVTSKPDQYSRLYLSRAARGKRCVVDEELLIVALEDRGFTCVTLETMSVTEQAALMASAKIVIAPHGAGLSNIAFCQTDTSIIEVFGNYVVPCYWALSELAGLSYHAFFVDDQQKATANELHLPKTATPIQRREQNISLDVDSLLAYIDPLLETDGPVPIS